MARQRPNILMLVMDRQRAIAVLGNPVIKTPALDRLARTGAPFRRAHTPCQARAMLDTLQDALGDPAEETVSRQ